MKISDSALFFGYSLLLELTILLVLAVWLLVKVIVGKSFSYVRNQLIWMIIYCCTLLPLGLRNCDQYVNDLFTAWQK